MKPIALQKINENERHETAAKVFYLGFGGVPGIHLGTLNKVWKKKSAPEEKKERKKSGIL